MTKMKLIVNVTCTYTVIEVNKMRGERLRDLRKALELSQEALAEILNTHQRQIWRWENGKNDPSGEEVAKLATALNVSTDYLLGLSDDPTPAAFAAATLSARERQALAAWRKGDRIEAVKVIATDE